MIASVVLAAGTSSRFGAHKLLAPVRSVPLVRRAVECVLSAQLGPVLVVLGRDAPAVAEALRGLPVRLVENTRYRDGMSTSLRAGVAAVLEMESAADAQLEGVAICLGDMPSVDAGILHPLAEALRSARKPMVAPSYRGTRGNPVLFAAALLPALLALEGDRGARDLLAARPQELALVPLDREVPRDVDTPEDLAALERER